MHSSLGSPPLSVLKTPICVLAVLCLLWLGSGCSQMNALEEQQVVLKQSIGINAEMTASLIDQMQEQREEIDSALDAFHKEQQGIISRQSELEDNVNAVASITQDMVGQVELISNEFDTFNSVIEKSQQSMAAQYNTINDAQSTLLETFAALQNSYQGQEDQIASLMTEQTTLREYLDEERDNTSTLADNYQTLNETLNTLQAREDERYNQTQAVVSKLEETPHASTVDLVTLEETVAQLTASIDILKTNQAQTEAAILQKNEELLQQIQALKTQHNQWQTELDTLQQETENLHSNAESLDQRLSEALTEVQQE